MKLYMVPIALQTIFTSAVLVANILIGLYVFVQNTRNLVHRAFFLFTSGIACYGVGLILLVFTKNFIFNNIVFYGGLFVFLGLVFLAKVFPDKTTVEKTFWLHFIPWFFIFIALPFNVIVKGLALNATGSITPILGPLFPAFAAIIAYYVVLILFLFIRNYRRAFGLPRLQMQYLFFGASVFIVSMFSFNVILPAFGIFGFNLLGPASSIVFVLFTAYAIVRHKFFDIRLLIIRAVSYALLVFALAAAYTFIILFGVQRIANLHVDNSILLTGFFVTLVAIFIFQPFERIVRRATKRVFYKDVYDTQELLTRLTRTMAETIDLDVLTDKIIFELALAIQIEKAAFLIIDSHTIVSIKGRGYAMKECGIPELEAFLHVEAHKEPSIVFDNLSEGPLKAILRRLDISVAIPIRVENDEVALLLVGPKLSGEAYYPEDIELLTTLASEAGIAIQNAKAYARIKAFSKELEGRVEERTRELKETQGRELEKAKDVARLKDEFVFIAAHELRTPVAAIKGFLELVEESKEIFPKNVREYLDSMVTASDNLAQLINDLLEIARSDAGAMKVETKAIDVEPVIESVLHEIASLAKKRGIVVSFDRHGEIPLVLADEGKFREVLMNLVGNAIKYNKENGSIRIVAFAEGDDLAVEVSDTGYGIPKDLQYKIFDKFFRARSPGTESVAGTGLGLFIARMLAQRMGGMIKFSSVEGQGSTFIFALPRPSSKHVSESSATAAEETS